MIISQVIQTIVMIVFDDYKLLRTYSEMKKIKKNKKDKAVGYLKRLYKE